MTETGRNPWAGLAIAMATGMALLPPAPPPPGFGRLAQHYRLKRKEEVAVSAKTLAKRAAMKRQGKARATTKSKRSRKGSLHV